MTRVTHCTAGVQRCTTGSPRCTTGSQRWSTGSQRCTTDVQHGDPRTYSTVTHGGMCRWSSGRGPPSEVVAEGLFVGNSGRDALARATTGQRTPTGDRPTKPRRTKQCTEGVRRRLSTVVYGGQQSLVHGGVQQVYSREYTEVQQCTAGSTRQCTAGLSVLVGVRQVSRYWSVYGRCTAGCTDGACSLVRCPLRLVYILYLLRRLVSGWCLLA